MNRPTDERIEELKEIIRIGISFDNRDINERHDWDDLYECEKVMTFDEYLWCQNAFTIVKEVKVYIEEPTEEFEIKEVEENE